MFKILLSGIIRENPIMILMIGLCPVLACSATATDALGMGIAATFVLVSSNFIISLIRKFVPDEVRIPIFIVVIATFVTIIDYILQGYFPSLSSSLGVFVPLIVVNCVILGRAEAFASKNPVLPSIADGVGMGLGFTLGIVALGVFREFLGSGTIFGLKLFDNPATIFILPPGAFIGIGILVALWQYLKKSTETKKTSPCRSCAMSRFCFPAVQKNITDKNTKS